MNSIKLKMIEKEKETNITLYNGSQCLKKVEELERGIVICLIEKLPFHFIGSGGSIVIPYETLIKQTIIKIFIG